MIAFVKSHVDEFLSLLDRLERGFNNLVRRADKGDDGAVGRCSGINVEQRYSVDFFDLVSNLPNDSKVAAFAKIWHAFN
jgi:hypothetical protein